MTRSLVVSAFAILIACGGTPRPPVAATPAAPAPAAAPATPDAGGHLAELESPPAKKRLAIDWSTVHLASDADALALWRQIAPTGADWQLKLDELPSDPAIVRPLTVAMLHADHVACSTPPPAAACGRPPIDVPAPAPSATLDDPCLRRQLVLWSLDQLDDADLAAVHDALRALAALPPPESQLVASALAALPATDQDGRLELLGIAWRAGQHEIVDGALGHLDEAHLITAATTLHIDGALDVLSAEGDRAVYLGAVTDEHMARAARVQAIADLVAADATAPGGGAGLARDLRTALIAATRSPDCTVAAAAARALDHGGVHRYLPVHHATRSTAKMMRQICVLAGYEQLQQPDELSLLPGYLPARGLELFTTAYDPYNEVDHDGDGDPHTERTVDLLPRAEATLPALDELMRALRDCRGTACRSEQHDVRFTFKPAPGRGLVLWGIEIADRLPCTDRHTIPPP